MATDKLIFMGLDNAHFLYHCKLFEKKRKQKLNADK